MPKTNIDKFDEITGRIFADLYGAFPQPQHIPFSSYIDEDEEMPVGENVDLLAYQDAQEEFIQDTVTWLIEAGFINAASLGNGCYYNAVLTAKGLECLKLIPNSLGVSAGKGLKDAVVAGSLDVVKSIANQVLAAGVSLALAKVGIS